MGEPKLTGKRLDGFLCGVSNLVDALPSPEQKASLAKELETLITFLTDLKGRLEAVPTDDEAGDIAKTVEKLRDYVRVAESDPVMSRVLGLVEAGRPTRTPRRTNVRTADEVKELLDKLRSMSPENVRTELSDKRTYNVPTLRTIANSIGVRMPSKSTRTSMVERLVTVIGNRSGYEYLRNQA